MDFEKLYNTYYMKVYSYILTLTHNKDVSEEITQSTFVKALYKQEKFRGDSSEFTWLCTIAKNQYLDGLRTEKHKTTLDAPMEATINIEHIVEDEDTMIRIHQILHNLEEPYKEVFQLRLFGELSFANIGVIFSKSESWARVTYYRAKLKIQERMEKE